MATCVRCPHTDDQHSTTVDGGFAECLQGDTCDGFFELVPAGTDIYGCGRCGAMVHDYGLHVTWHL